jgi:hypothetical protein
MSKYTTEVRFICESLSGLEESKGVNDIDTIINNSWDQIFTTNVTFFDPAYKSVLCKKILKHYYLREICSETVGIWKLWMNEKLEMIMPYYNQMYESQLLVFDPLKDVNVTRTYNKETDGTENTTGTSEGTSNNTNRDLYSDTPQGAITGLENENYLTNARKVTDNGTTTGEYENNRDANTTEEYVETLLGKHGSGTYSKMLQEFRETFLNIDAMVIEEFSDLFFGLW